MRWTAVRRFHVKHAGETDPCSSQQTPALRRVRLLASPPARSIRIELRPFAMLDTLPEAKRTAGPIDAITCEAPVSE